VTDYHVITPEAAELVMQVVDGELIIVPPAALSSLPGSGPAQHGASSPSSSTISE
jgi:hypothetical protein